MFEGLCCGGPLDGKRQAFEAQRFDVRAPDFSKGPLRQTLIGHYQFLVGFWLWMPAETERRHA